MKMMRTLGNRRLQHSLFPATSTTHVGGPGGQLLAGRCRPRLHGRSGVSHQLMSFRPSPVAISPEALTGIRQADAGHRRVPEFFPDVNGFGLG